jgi:probable H4MPT-linked C1 transfer pathway protein
MSDSILGWDVGGANVKAVFLDSNRHTLPRVLQRPFAMWREPQRLPQILTEVAAVFPPTAVMAVTMTAELADCFATKREGVRFVLDAFRTAFPRADPAIFAVDGRFRTAHEARLRPHDVAAANWMAGAMLVARTHPDALFIDTGSTTTDIIPVVGGRVEVQGLTDPDRLCTGELVYTGATRTPVCGIVRWVPFRNRRCRVAAEHFAIAADVHLWLRDISELEYACDTPDGRGRSRPEVAARLARIACADCEMIDGDEITLIAEHIAAVQVRLIGHGIRQVMRKLGASRPRQAILAGQGTFLARAAAARAGLAVSLLSDEFGGAAEAVPAAAVAYLLDESLTVTSRAPLTSR